LELRVTSGSPRLGRPRRDGDYEMGPNLGQTMYKSETLLSGTGNL
jgi:hypothetical protein